MKSSINRVLRWMPVSGLIALFLFMIIIPGVLAFEVNTQPTTVKVLSIAYYPEDPNNRGYFNLSIVGDAFRNTPINSIQQKVQSLNAQGLTDLSDASKYHGYSDSTARAFLRYQLVTPIKEYFETMTLQNATVPWNSNAHRPEYIKILSRENICDWVDNKGVREVWLWGYHYGPTEPAESNQAMGTNSKAYWNYPTFGDVSNSERTNDLPVCKHSYVLFNYNYGRDIGEFLEDHTHQLEALFRYFEVIDQNYLNEEKIWTDLFVRESASGTDTARCGWTHFPPNILRSEIGYNWYSKKQISSDCMDWKPDGTGKRTVTSCESWDGPNCTEDGGRGFKIWWMQNLPGFNNRLEYKTRAIRNWWEAVSDFDSFRMDGGLTQVIKYPDLVVGIVQRQTKPYGRYSIEICNRGDAAPIASYTISITPYFASTRQASRSVELTVPNGTPWQGSCTSISLSCLEAGDADCKVASGAIIRVDSNNTIQEKNENNNERDANFGKPEKIVPMPTM